jgi:hypothetical protein
MRTGINIGKGHAEYEATKSWNDATAFGHHLGMEEGFNLGRTEGIGEGFTDGYEEGYAAGWAAPRPSVVPMPKDVGAAAHKAACDRLTQLWEAWDAEQEGYDAEWPENAGAFCGCQDCEVREVLTAAWDTLAEAFRWEVAKAAATYLQSRGLS